MMRRPVNISIASIGSIGTVALAVMVATLVQTASAQVLRDKRVHRRGTLHETVYNTGEIGRAWRYRDHDITLDPLMEWPGNSATLIDGLQYSGQHNIIGGGISIAASYRGTNIFDLDQRLYSFGGSAGQHIPTTVAGVYSFPISIERFENYPLLDDGSLNPAYDPDEAEEVIVAEWGSNTGISVKRTSRAWSYPDYDDFIIYEYTFENTGDTDGDGIMNNDSTLYEVLIGFHYGVAPSMLGFQRWYGTWEYDFMYKNDLRGYFDRHRWLRYVVNIGNGVDADFAESGKPDPKYFDTYASTGQQGGGLMSPQVPGIQMLYYDRNHLATRGNTYALDPRVSNERMIDADSTLKQPFMNKVESGNSREDKMKPKLVPYTRWSGTYTPYRETQFPPPPGTEDSDSLRWTGRGAFNFRQSYKAVGHHIVFGPYILPHGAKLEFSLAEVVGYGAAKGPGEWDEGGGLGEVIDEQMPWHEVPHFYDRVIDPNTGQTLTDNYIGTYGYPEYVNSDIQTVKDVADMAYNAYTGQPPVLPYWPEDNPAHGIYQVPVPPPAPVLNITNNDRAHAVIRWGRVQESFSHPRLTGAVTSYRVLSAQAAIGPWQTLAEVPVGSTSYLTDSDQYEFIDDATTVGESKWYAVTALDSEGRESGKTNLTNVLAALGPADELTEVHAVPNPFYLNSGFTSGGAANVAQQIGFYGLPERATIDIYSYSGQLVETIEHDAARYSTPWFQVTRNDQEIASGVYFFVVSTPDGGAYRGKFVVIK